MRLLLRADASRAAGAGHLVRCLAVAEQARARGHDVVLAADLGGGVARRLVERSGVAVLPPPSWADLAEVARDQAADAVHVDDYAAPSDLRERLDRVGLMLSGVEDGPWGRRPADVVVDPSLAPAARPADGSGFVLRGPRAALVRADVRRARVRRSAFPARGSRTEVLVVMGGTDARGVLPRAVEAVVEARRDVLVTVLAPDGLDATGARPATDGTEVRVVAAAAELPDLAASAVLVLTAAGTTVSELCCIGVPMAVVPVVDNQRAVHDAVVAAGVGVGLGTPEQLAAAPAVLAALLDDTSARERMARTGLATVDGLGPARLLAALERALGTAERTRPSSPAGVDLRPAVPADSDVLLEWRNDEVTRRWSRRSHVVAPSEHDAWFSAALGSVARHLLVAEDAAACPVGTVRWDADPAEPGAWEVSITLAPEARGRGWSGPVLAAAERWLASEDPTARHLLARVRPENVASDRLFRRAAYDPGDGCDDAGFVTYRKRLAG